MGVCVLKYKFLFSITRSESIHLKLVNKNVYLIYKQSHLYQLLLEKIS